MGKEVSRSTEAKIKAMLARGLPSNPGKLVGGGTERYDTHIRITGDIYREQDEESESGSDSGEFVPEEWVGYWPGVITHWNPTDATWIEFGPCLVLPANWGEFVVGKRYRALCYGNLLQGFPEWERLVFVADDGEVPDDESGGESGSEGESASEGDGGDGITDVSLGVDGCSITLTVTRPSGTTTTSIDATTICGCCESTSDDGSGSDDTSDGSDDGSDDEEGVPCGECFGEGTPNPTDATPATVTATFNGGEYVQPFSPDGNWEYQAGPTVIPGVLAMSVHLNCNLFCVGPDDPPVSCLLLNKHPDPSEQVPLTIVSCSPFVATGTSTYGGVIVSE